MTAADPGAGGTPPGSCRRLARSWRDATAAGRHRVRARRARDRSPRLRGLQATCHEAARRLKGTILRADGCAGRVTPNFHRVALSLPDGAVEVICNARYPLVAAIRPLEVGIISLTFIDVPRLAVVLAESGFEVVPAADLNEPVRAGHLAGLASAERHQAKYWNPETVGQVVFNFWD